MYRPTTFWAPGVRRLVSEMETLGLETFKRWPEGHFWFYPLYGRIHDRAAQRRGARAAATGQPQVARTWARRVLSGASDARRDFDVCRMAWDQERWPFDLESFGESAVGGRGQAYGLVAGEAKLTKPYLSYLLCLAALSRHVDAPPSSFLELGGGFGVLGEIVLARDPEARYVNCDIPPLLTVSSYYLSELFGDDAVLTFDDRVPDTGVIEWKGSACLPNWRIADLQGPFDVFLNSFSFQEMEPSVVENYVSVVAELGVEYVVSLNSRRGKHVQVGDEPGVREQVTSERIIEMFERRGYRLCGTYDDPLVRAAGQVAVLQRG